MMRIFFIPAFIVFSLTMRCNSPWQKGKDTVLIKLEPKTATDVQLIRIKICSDDIVQVSATSQNSFSTRPSLMAAKIQWQPVPWSMTENVNEVEIATAKLKLTVNRDNGAIAFHDARGNVILQEKANGKIFTPVEVMGENTFHVQQLFHSPEDEAFYGLGAHQNDVMNYKGHDVDLYQLNIVDVVPFLVSNKNYGILWDNNSRTKFGDIRDYQPISSLTLYNKDGEKGALTAEYFKKPDFQSSLITRDEARIEYENTDAGDPFPDGFDYNTCSVRWSGAIEGTQSGVYKLRLFSSCYCKMWLKDEPVLDSWRQGWMPWTHLFKVPMETGKRYPIKIEWSPQYGQGFVSLKFLSPEPVDSRTSISLWSEVADQIEYYFIHGDNPDQVIRGYREITGEAPMMPKWAMGLWQCRQRYETQEQLLSVVREFRKRHIPLDNIVQDWFYWEADKWGDHEFDKTRFPDADAMVKELHNDLHTRIMISVWPKFYVGTKNYQAFDEKGWMYKRNVEMNQKDWVGYVCSFYDPYREEARQMFWQQMNEKLFSKGFDAWWMDATEPDIQSNLSEQETRLRMHPTALGTAARYRNTYSLMNSMAVYQGQRQVNLDQRVFILTRSAFAGQQRYAAATWSGDIAARWYDLKAQISAGMNFCMSGIPWWTMDIGGFAVERRFERATGETLDEWRELMTRWFQFGAFCPLFRVHGEFPYREMFYVAPEDHPAYQAMLAYDKLRYRLMPYIYSLSGMVTHQDYTIMRGLVMDFGSDMNVLDIGDQYMFGPALLVNPVSQYKARVRQVYLPSGCGWYDLFSGRYFEGGNTIQADAPYANIPVFARTGSVIPFGPEMEYSDEKPADPLRVYVYTGQDGVFDLYEDENVNYNYEKGKFAVIPFRYDEASHTLTIGERKGDFPGMLTQRTIEVVWVTPEKKIELDFAVKPDKVVSYDGAAIVVKME